MPRLRSYGSEVIPTIRKISITSSKSGRTQSSGKTLVELDRYKGQWAGSQGELYGRRSSDQGTKRYPPRTRAVISPDVTGHGDIEGQRGARSSIDREVERELKYLPDPMKLGFRIMDLLEEGNGEKALEIVRAASSRMECIVSWNHLIKYHMGCGSVSSALKLYNEVSRLYSTKNSLSNNLLAR
jgi:hypothetical protein